MSAKDALAALALAAFACVLGYLGSRWMGSADPWPAPWARPSAC